MGTETETFVQMGTSINGENEMGKNKCPGGGRKEFWRHKKRKMKRICCCFGFILLLNLFVTFCVLFHTGAILHEVHELKDMDSKSFCSSFCMDFCDDNDCDDLYTCRDLCQSNVQSTLGSMDSSSDSKDDDDEEEVDDDEETTTVAEAYGDDVSPVEDEDPQLGGDEDYQQHDVEDEPAKLGGDEDYQQHGETKQPPKSGGDEDYQQHSTATQQEDPQQVSSSNIVSGTDSLPAPGDDTTEDAVEDVDDESTTGDGRGEGGRRHHGKGENSESGRQHDRGDGGRHHGKNGGGRFKRFRH